VYGAKEESLQKLIEIEKMHWAEFQPVCVFLLKRHNSLKSPPVAHWSELTEAYEVLAQQECTTTRIQVIANEATTDDALRQIIEVYESFTKKNGV